MIPAGARVFVATRPVDVPTGSASLMALVKASGADPFSGALTVLRAKRADRVKIVWWDGTGLCLFAKLLDDPETLKAMLVALRTENETLKAVNADAEARMARLTALLKALERARYGRRSEALDAEQHAFAFEEIETGVAAVEASLVPGKQREEKAPRQRKPLPAHLASAAW